MAHTQLSKEERELIAIHYNQGKSYAEIGRILNRPHTTIKREIDRNGKEDRSKIGIKYSCFTADMKSKDRKIKANRKRKKLLKTHWLREFIHKKLANNEEAWSPDTLANRLKQERWITISWTTIYSFIHNNSPSWKQYLRHGNWYKAYWTSKWYKRYLDSKHISLRPMEANERNTLWHYEWDTVMGSGKSSLLTLTDRKSRILFIRKLHTLHASETTYKILEAFKNKHMKTITFDRWSEFAYYDPIEKRLWCDVYFTSPYSSRQKWSIERNNREIRVYLPKWSSFDDVNEAEIKKIENKINRKPRKILWYQCSYEVFHSTNIHLL